jgi:short-subunit dehydrogenase
MSKSFAIVTGASSGIGLELGAICAQEGFDLLVAADRPEIRTAADRFRRLGADVMVVEADLATTARIKPSTTGPKHSWIRFSFALRAELKDTGVTVTCLLPGATETDFFERADMLDTKVGQSKKDDPADVARVGFDAMMRGDGDVVSGWKNKLQSAIANVTPAGVLAEQHRRMAEPGSGLPAND